MKVGAVGIESPPFPFNDDPGLVTGADKLACYFLLSNSGDGLRTLGQIDGKLLQIVLNVGVNEVIDDAVAGIKLIDAGVVDLDGGCFVVDEDVVASLRAPTSVTALHCCTALVGHENGIVANQVAMASPKRQIERSFYLIG